MARLAGSRDSQPRRYEGEKSSTESENYAHFDSGCEKATAYLREHYPLEEGASECLECPLAECYYSQDNRGHGGRPKRSS